MAQTGINIKVADTVLGSPPSVNANTMMFVQYARGVDNGRQPPFDLNTPYKLRSLADLEAMGVLYNGNEALYTAVRDFYYPNKDVDNTGTILWVVGWEHGFGATMDDDPALANKIVAHVISTTIKSFSDRPRTLVWFNPDASPANFGAPVLSDAISRLRSEGIYVVGLIGLAMGSEYDFGAIIGETDTLLEDDGYPFVGWNPFFHKDISLNLQPTVAMVAGLLASVSVGTSIGDMSLPPIGEDIMFETQQRSVKTLTSSELMELGGAQVIFARTRPPRNGLWWNDGATLNDTQNALSTLEAVRTLCSVVDDLRLFFTNYINTRVPVAANGDIDPTYKQVVLDNARAKVITPYIESGDISDARIELVAKNNNMVSTRTWEVKVSILPAPTLRWIDGFVFYVNSL